MGGLEKKRGREVGRDEGKERRVWEREGKLMNENLFSWICELLITEATLSSMGTSLLLLLTGNTVTRMPKTRLGQPRVSPSLRLWSFVPVWHGLLSS